MTGSDALLGVAEAAAEAGISPHALRYYERVGLLAAVPRSRSDRRLYGQRERSSVEFITRLRATGMPIAQILVYADLVRAGKHTEHERLGLLLAHHDEVRRRLQEQQEHLAAIAVKIKLSIRGSFPPKPISPTSRHPRPRGAPTAPSARSSCEPVSPPVR